MATSHDCPSATRLWHSRLRECAASLRSPLRITDIFFPAPSIGRQAARQPGSQRGVSSAGSADRPRTNALPGQHPVRYRDLPGAPRLAAITTGAVTDRHLTPTVPCCPHQGPTSWQPPVQGPISAAPRGGHFCRAAWQGGATCQADPAGKRRRAPATAYGICWVLPHLRDRWRIALGRQIMACCRTARSVDMPRDV